MKKVNVEFLVKNEAHCAAEGDVRPMDENTARLFEGWGWVKILPEPKTEKAKAPKVEA